ncbi:MAG: hypothetical protein JSV19_06055 [Phycisphaerales bacterium]|nr:MAG: hypothetical protein JSV19_06055 [Phycisphaerales bacterium]
MKAHRSRSERPIRRHLLRACSVLFHALVAAGVVYLAITRWNGVPADPIRPTQSTLVYSPPLDPALDRTEELLAALGALPSAPALTLPPAPPGMQWTGRVSGAVYVVDACCGEWTPETRPNLQGVIAFLETPETIAALSRVTSIEPGGWRPFGSTGAGSTALRGMGQAPKLLVARARYHHAHRGDVDAALGDLAAAYRFAAAIFDSGAWLGLTGAAGCQVLADHELQCLARECELTRTQAARMSNIVCGTTLDRATMWRTATAIQLAELERIIDAGWTDDGYGNGWLVLSHLNSTWQPDWTSSPRVGAWNMLSPFFNDRRTVRGKVALLREVYESAADLPYREAMSVLEAVESPRMFNLTDGPLSLSLMFPISNMCRRSVSTSASRRATIVALALSAYRHDHGEYPVSLEELLNGYLDVIPMDPYADDVLRYRRQGAEFVLYSVGPNGADDGGKKYSVDQTIGRPKPYGDWVYTPSRRDPRFEPTLEPAEQ